MTWNARHFQGGTNCDVTCGHSLALLFRVAAVVDQALDVGRRGEYRIVHREDDEASRASGARLPLERLHVEICGGRLHIHFTFVLVSLVLLRQEGAQGEAVAQPPVANSAATRSTHSLQLSR